VNLNNCVGNKQIETNLFHSFGVELSCVRFECDICDLMLPVSLEIHFLTTSIYHFKWEKRSRKESAQNQRSSESISKQIWGRGKKLITKTLMSESPDCVLFHRPSDKAKVKNYTLESNNMMKTLLENEKTHCVLCWSWVFPMRMICAMFGNQFHLQVGCMVPNFSVVCGEKLYEIYHFPNSFRASGANNRLIKLKNVWLAWR
jgi:hypothetical protein